MGIGSFFKRIASFIERATKVVRQVVPEEILTAAVDYVRQAAGNLIDNSGRREWAVKQLQTRFHIGESVARLAVELAVQIVKRELD